MTNFLTFIGGFIVAILLAIYSTISYTYVSLKTYNWFIKPNFETSPNLEFIHILGIILLFSVIKPKFISHLKSEYENQLNKWFNWICGPWLMLMMIWIFKLIFLN